MGVRAELLESVDEQRVSWLRECVEDFAGVPGVRASAYVHHLVETLLALAAHGACVILGRGAAQFLPRETTLRVRLVAPLQERIAAISRERGLTWEEATDYLDRIDRGRIQFVRDHFHKDPTDLQQYDLVLNAGRFSVAGCADLVIAALHHLQARRPEKGLAALVPEKEVLAGPI
jgi:cytidylate kinase